MRLETRTGPAATHAVDQLRKGAVPIHKLAAVVVASVVLPVVVLDARQRPDLRDLPRVHRFDGPGDTTTFFEAALNTSDRAAEIVVFRVELARPVRCDFRIAFELATSQGFLEAVESAGYLIVAFGPAPLGDGLLERAIGFSIATTDLTRILRIVALRDALTGRMGAQPTGSAR